MAETENIVALLASVASYGGQMAAVLHNYALTSDRTVADFEGSIAILDATVVTLKQVLELVRDHVEHGKILFSQQGLEYAHLLAVECGNTFIRIEATTMEGNLSREERMALHKERIRPLKVVPASILANMTLDEKSFLQSVEKGVRAWKNMDVWEFIERLHDLQLHLLLVYQVVTVGALSKDLSSGKVDIQSIVSYHNRIERAARLVGIETRKDRRRRPSLSDSSSGTSDSDSDSSTASSVASRARPPTERRVYDRPPLPRAFPRPCPSPPSGWLNSPPSVQIPKPTPVMPHTVQPQSMNPQSPPSVPGPGPTGPPMTMSHPANVQQGNPPAYMDRPTMSPGEKDPIKEDEDLKVKDPVKPTTHKAHLFKTQPRGLAFKLKSIFSSRESLAREMKRTLKDNESDLLAFVIHDGGFDIVPHSAFHSLESTHMKTILSQLHDNTWYNTFTRLTLDEHNLLLHIISPVVGGKSPDRELVVLKLLREQNYTSGLKLPSWASRVQPYPNGADDRALLVIIREKLVDGKTLMRPHPSNRPPRPVTVDTASPDMKDHEARQSLISFVEYTIRFRDHHANGARPLAPIVERLHNDQPHIRQRLQSFVLNGGNVIEMTLLLTDRQSEHVNVLMKDIIGTEDDPRFEWCWVELSLHNRQGEITDFYPRRPSTSSLAETANVMHLIAKRSLKPYINPVNVRNTLTYGPPLGFNPGPPPATLNLQFPQYSPPPFPPPHAPRGPMVGSVPRPPWPAHMAAPYPQPAPGLGPNPTPNCRIDPSMYSDSSDSDASTVRDVRGQLRQAKKLRISRRHKSKRSVNDSDSDASEIYEGDNIVVDLQLKKGDDVVTKLLEIWTPCASTNGTQSA